MIIYSMEVTEVGASAKELMDAGYLITFDESVPDELAEVSVLVRPGVLVRGLEAGDCLQIDGTPFQVTAVGKVANQNLKEMAHAIWQFDGRDAPRNPGEVHLEAGKIPTIAAGTVMTVHGHPPKEEGEA